MENQWILCSLFVLVKDDFLFGLLSQSPASVAVYVCKGDHILQTKCLPETAFLHTFQLSEFVQHFVAFRNKLSEKHAPFSTVIGQEVGRVWTSRQDLIFNSSDNYFSCVWMSATP